MCAFSTSARMLQYYIICYDRLPIQSVCDSELMEINSVPWDNSRKVEWELVLIPISYLPFNFDEEIGCITYICISVLLNSVTHKYIWTTLETHCDKCYWLGCHGIQWPAIVGSIREQFLLCLRNATLTDPIVAFSKSMIN